MSEIDRRRLLLGGSVVGATAWVAPSILSIDRVSAATGSLGSLITASQGVTILSPPYPDFTMNNFEDDTTTYVVPEAECTILPGGIVVNRSTPGIFDGSGPGTEQTTLPAGTAVCSFYVHADRDSTGNLSGSLTFTSQIVGVIYKKNEFDDTTPLLGIPGVTYPNPATAFLERDDTLTFSADRLTLSWSLQINGNFMEAMRILVAC